tara:strand:+ start:12429 stop:12749 length:321 start_codon:yes stop_codon:yes gene_type:complete
MFKLNFLYKENDLNKLIKKNKKDRRNISILFLSLWDDYSQSLADQLKEKYEDLEKGEPLYLVDSFHMPHSFVIYSTTKIPHLVQLRRDKQVSEDYLPNILKALKIS